MCKEEFSSASTLREKSSSKFNVLPEIPKSPRQENSENMELVMCEKRGCVEARKLVISTQTYFTAEFARMEKKYEAELESKKAEKCQNCEKREVKFSESTNERYRKTLEEKLEESEQLLNVSAENENLVKELESMRLINLQLQQEMEEMKNQTSKNLPSASKKEMAALQALLESNKEQYSKDIYEMQERIKTLQKELKKTGAQDPEALRNGIEIINFNNSELEKAEKQIAEKDEIIWNLRFEMEVKNKEENAMHS
ncbi:unnamed protein product [Oikopleura dioica]|uniref:Uncharacterized protein n=1 Tax=Oikopleura dioica TaxID=34765 RepID=E4XPI1_OIKDI|nr:unnamed protein product [Oikopleura dioica]CBY38460.1 unnamed protein product [Oikopleura dioica]